MKGLVRSVGGLALVIWLAQSSAASTTSHVSPQEIMMRAVHRAQTTQRLPDCQYLRTSTERDFDSRGRIENQSAEVYRVLIEDGHVRMKLLEYDGRDLSPEEARSKQAQEQAEKEKLRGPQAALEDARPQALLTRDLVSRYQFTLLNIENVNGRETYHMAFAPRRGLRIRDLSDRFFNHIAGAVWIDAEDYELARAEIHLTSEFRLWAGIVAAVKRCDFRLEQTRLPNGTWLNRSLNGSFVVRKFLVTTRSEIAADSTSFQIEPHPAMSE